MNDFKMNKIQTSVLIITAIVAVATITAGILLNAGGKSKIFKPVDSIPQSNSTILNDTTKPSDPDKLNPEGSQAEVDEKEGSIKLPEQGNDTESKPNTEKIPKQEVVPKPATENQPKSEIVQKPITQTPDKPSGIANDMPKDRPDSKPSATKGESKLVPDSQNPILNASPAKVNEVKGSDYYFNGIPAGQGDKF